MKKYLLLIMLLLIVLASPVFATAPYQLEQLMIGYVESTVSFSVRSIEESLPFDLDGSEVQYNPSTTQVRGIRIGEYTLISNNTQRIELYVSHTPLRLNGTGATGGEYIDYRLYLITGDNVFESCRSDNNASTPMNATEHILFAPAQGGVSLLGKSLYVSLDEGSENATNTVLERLQPGTYKSNIYFLLRGGY